MRGRERIEHGWTIDLRARQRDFGLQNLSETVDMAALAANGLIAAGGYAGHKLGLLQTPPPDRKASWRQRVDCRQDAGLGCCRTTQVVLRMLMVKLPVVCWGLR